MRPAKRSGFLMFVAALIPGAAQMYMGFMKFGISLMAAFLTAAAAAGELRGLAFMACIAMLIWFYSFFHARNLAAMDAEAFTAYEDRYFWEELLEDGGIGVSDVRRRKIFAWVLIILGCLVMWGYVSDLIYRLLPEGTWDMMYRIISRMPELFIAALLIALGVRLVSSRKEEFIGDAVYAQETVPSEEDGEGGQTV